jgi:hypothetical protein
LPKNQLKPLALVKIFRTYAITRERKLVAAKRYDSLGKAID